MIPDLFADDADFPVLVLQVDSRRAGRQAGKRIPPARFHQQRKVRFDVAVAGVRLKKSGASTAGGRGFTILLPTVPPSHEGG